MVVAPAWGATVDGGLSFEHRRWTLADGAPGQTFDLAQTTDGLMWFASPTGLYSFDGVKFQHHAAVYGQPLLSPNTIAVHPLPQRGLAVGYAFGGVSLFTPQGATHFAAGPDFPLGSARSIAADADGAVYACTPNALVVLKNGKWLPVGHADWTGKGLQRIDFDGAGGLWLRTREALYVRRPGTQELVFVSKTIGQMAGGTVRQAMQLKLPNGEFVLLNADGTRTPFKLEKSALFEKLVTGPNGALAATRDDGIARLAQRPDGGWYEAEFYPPSDGSGKGGMGLAYITDREGNLWETTYEGVNKIRLHRFHQLKKHDIWWVAQPGLGNEMWVGGDRYPMLRLQPDGVRHTVALTSPTALLRLAPDHVWVASREGMTEFVGGATRRWGIPGEPSGDFQAQAMATDADGTLLVSVRRQGLWRFERNGWRQDMRLRDQSDPTPISMLRDSHGQTWVGLTANRVGRLTADGVQLLPPGANLRIGNTLSMLDAGGRLLIGGDMGVAWIEDGKVQQMTFRQRGPVLRVTGLVVDGLGQLWIHCNDGLLLVSAAELARFWRAPAQPVSTEFFNFEDGISGTAAAIRPLPSLSVDPAGKVFYATSSQVGWIDPAHIRRNARAPDVLIQSVRTAAGELRAIDGMQLPGHPTAVELTFTATALSVPERVRLKYRLEGVDTDWRDVQRERSAQYINLGPGTYRFQVIAANEDGVWNLQGAALRFEIVPQFWQTTWFRALCVLLVILLGALVYRWRIAVVRRRAELAADERSQARLDATLQERTRIARSLHDNLLQAVQALIIRFHSVQTRMPQEPQLQEHLDQVLSYAEELVGSTRDEVEALRRDPSCEELFARLHQALAGAMPGAEALLTCSTVGQPRLLRDPVAGELLYVLREAVWNSARHAQASGIKVTLHFDDQALTGEVTDDGIGISAAHATAGAAGHWGIVGMRERIERLGGTLSIGAATPRGVTLRFTLPARQAYRDQAWND
jgi:signal transduction histidine kinase/ligand-binding sensor domain-containing protein